MYFTCIAGRMGGNTKLTQYGMSQLDIEYILSFTYILHVINLYIICTVHVTCDEHWEHTVQCKFLMGEILTDWG